MDHLPQERKTRYGCFQHEVQHQQKTCRRREQQPGRLLEPSLIEQDLRAAYANCIIAHPSGIVRGVDFQKSGKVERVDAKILELFLNEEIVPLPLIVAVEPSGIVQVPATSESAEP